MRRLASRAALIWSSVLKSGSDSLTRSLARATLRLCTFANRLSIVILEYATAFVVHCYGNVGTRHADPVFSLGGRRGGFLFCAAAALAEAQSFE